MDFRAVVWWSIVDQTVQLGIGNCCTAVIAFAPAVETWTSAESVHGLFSANVSIQDGDAAGLKFFLSIGDQGRSPTEDLKLQAFFHEFFSDLHGLDCCDVIRNGLRELKYKPPMSLFAATHQKF